MLVLRLGLGTSDQVQIGGAEYKRDRSLHHSERDKVVFIHKDWTSKKAVAKEHNPPRMETTMQRIFEPASNVDRKKEEGCMNKIKIERAVKLVSEDCRGRGYNILSGSVVEPKVWIAAMGAQANLI